MNVWSNRDWSSDVCSSDLVTDHLTLGATWNVSKQNEVTVAYMHAFEQKVNGPGAIPAGFGTGDANLHMNENSLGVAYSWKM
jgi:long-chain fatty acid transport protein